MNAFLEQLVGSKEVVVVRDDAKLHTSPSQILNRVFIQAQRGEKNRTKRKGNLPSIHKSSLTSRWDSCTSLKKDWSPIPRKSSRNYDGICLPDKSFQKQGHDLPPQFPSRKLLQFELPTVDICRTDSFTKRIPCINPDTVNVLRSAIKSASELESSVSSDECQVEQ